MITNAFENAYKKAATRGFDKIYIAIDLHDTIVRSTYKADVGYEFINDSAKECLLFLSQRKEVCLILWSSLRGSEKNEVLNFMKIHGINFQYVNCNPLEKNTEYANFSEKFYFSILIDDKAGFDADTDWVKILDWYRTDNVKDDDLVYRLRKRAQIRRNILSRKSVQEGRPDRISNLLEEAADEIENLRKENHE